MLSGRNLERYLEVNFGLTKRIQLAKKFPFLKKVVENDALRGTIILGDYMMMIIIIIVFFVPLSLLPTPEKYEFYLVSYGTLFFFQVIKFLSILFNHRWHAGRLAAMYVFLSRIAIIIIIIVLIGPNHSILGWVGSILDNVWDIILK